MKTQPSSRPESARDQRDESDNSVERTAYRLSSQPHTRIFARIPALDGLRGIAILLVFFYHYGGGTHSSNRLVHAIGEACKIGWIGVTLFFVLSGYLITGILWRTRFDPHWARHFYTRRALRIFPLYYLSLAVILIEAVFRHSLLHALSGLWVFALFLQNIPPFTQAGMAFPFAVVAAIYWSLAVEEHFYLLWPWLLHLVAARKRAQHLCVALFLLSLAFRILLVTSPHFSAFNVEFTVARIGDLAVGCWLALATAGHASTWRSVAQLAAPTAATCASIFLACALRSHSLALEGPLMTTLGLSAAALFCGCLVVLGLGVTNPLQRALSARWLRFFGRISYGIYLIHVAVYPLARRIAVHSVPLGVGSTRYHLILSGSAALLTLVLATLSFRYFETPFLRLKSAFLLASANDEATA